MKRIIIENANQVITILAVPFDQLLNADQQCSDDLFVLMHDGLFVAVTDADLGPHPKIQLNFMLQQTLRGVLTTFDRKDIVYCHKLTDDVYHVTVNHNNSYTTYQLVVGYAVTKLMPCFQPEDVGCTYQKPMSVPVAQPWYPAQEGTLAQPRFMSEGHQHPQGEVDLSE